MELSTCEDVRQLQINEQKWREEARQWKALYESSLVECATKGVRILELEEESRQWEKTRLVDMVHEIGRLKQRLQQYEPT